MWYYLFLTCGLIINKSRHNKMWEDLFDKATHWRNVIYMILITFVFRDSKYLGRLQDSKRNSHFSYNYILKERDVTYCLVTFITFISFTKVHLFISCTNAFISSFLSISFILQIMVHLIHIHHIWFCSYHILFQPHYVFHFFNQPVSGN